jgi:hypothetical protein
MGDRRAMSEDPVSRAVRLLMSTGSAASVACSNCHRVALSLNTAAVGLAGRPGIWARCKALDMTALFLRTDGVNATDARETLLVTGGAIVLCAQQVIFAGLEHDMTKCGFTDHLEPITQHLCNKCTNVDGVSLRLRLNTRATIEKDLKDINGVFHKGAVDNAKLRLRCSDKDCDVTTHTGTLRVPTHTSKNDTGGQKKHISKACAMGALASTDAWDMNRHGQLIYFSRHKGKTFEDVGGVLLWIVDQRLTVVQADHIPDLFPRNVVCYELTSLNALCHTHTHTYPRPCAICAREIQSEHEAVSVDLLSAPVHVKGCAQKCTVCKHATVARLGPTPEEGTTGEQCIALPAKCASCASGTSKHAQATTQKLVSLPQIVQGDRPGRPSAKMVRETAMNALKGKSDGATSSTGFKRKENWIGDLKEGLYPGDGGNFHMPDGTWVYKENVDGAISKRAICGQWFREADGGLSVYEWGKRVHHEPVQK